MRFASRGGGALLLAGLAGALGAGAPSTRTIDLIVRETAGIRRTEYPVGTVLALPRGAVTDLAHVRLARNGSEVPAQFSAVEMWDEGSVSQVAVDWNATLGPAESQTYRFEHGSDVTAAARPRTALTVIQSEQGVQVGNVRFGPTGWPLLASIGYRGEIIRPGANGLVIVDAAGVRHDFGSARTVVLEVVKRGPLVAAIRYSGRVPIDATSDVRATVTCEMPNSKSWVKLTASVEGGRQQIRAVRFETPLSLGAYPWTWDFATDSGTYGAFRAPADMARLIQTVAPAGNRWRVETGTASASQIYEQSIPGRAATAAGWGHLLDGRNAIAFAIDGFASMPGSYVISLDGQGQAAFEIALASPANAARLTVFQHFVSTPVPIGAATSPFSMIKPLRVDVK
jgi:hypothetical protein